jgi:pyruvate kinase
MSLRVSSILDDLSVECSVVLPGVLRAHKGVNLPDVSVELPSVSEKDREDIAFAAKMGVDMLFVSFVRKRDDVLEVREVLSDAGKISF